MSGTDRWTEDRGSDKQTRYGARIGQMGQRRRGTLLREDPDRDSAFERNSEMGRETRAKPGENREGGAGSGVAAGGALRALPYRAGCGEAGGTQHQTGFERTSGGNLGGTRRRSGRRAKAGRGTKESPELRDAPGGLESARGLRVC